MKWDLQSPWDQNELGAFMKIGEWPEYLMNREEGKGVNSLKKWAGSRSNQAL